MGLASEPPLPPTHRQSSVKDHETRTPHVHPTVRPAHRNAHPGKCTIGVPRRWVTHCPRGHTRHLGAWERQLHRQRLRRPQTDTQSRQTNTPVDQHLVQRAACVVPWKTTAVVCPNEPHSLNPAQAQRWPFRGTRVLHLCHPTWGDLTRSRRRESHHLTHVTCHPERVATSDATDTASLMHQTP